VNMHIQTPPPCRGRRPRPAGGPTGPAHLGHLGGGPAPTGQAPPPAAIRPPPPAAAAAAVLFLLQTEATATSSARRAPSPAAPPVTAGRPASSSLEASIFPPGPATRDLPSPKATLLRWARPCIRTVFRLSSPRSIWINLVHQFNLDIFR
jgi:hypothetical protein